MPKKIVKLVTIPEREVQAAGEETLVMQGFIDELEAVVDKYEDELHPHDIVAILSTTQLAFQLVYCIEE